MSKRVEPHRNSEKAIKAYVYTERVSLDDLRLVERPDPTPGSKRWSIHGVPTMSDKKVSPTDFAAEIARLKAEGKMPTLDEVLDAVADTRKKFVPKILKARQSLGS